MLPMDSNVQKLSGKICCQQVDLTVYRKTTMNLHKTGHDNLHVAYN